MKTKLSIAGLVLGYFAVCCYLSLPYYFCPNDDTQAWEMLYGKLAMRPYYILSDVWLRVVNLILHTPSTLALSSCICNSLCLFCLVFLSYRITKSYIVATILFVTSAWPMSYCFNWSYTPLSTLCVFTAFLFLYKNPLSIFGLLFLGISVFTSIATLPMVFLVFTVCLIFNFKEIKTKRLVLTIVSLVLLASIVYPFIDLHKIIWFVVENVRTKHSPQQPTHAEWAMSKYGYVPKAPLLAGAWIATQYNPIFLGCLLISFGCVFFLPIDIKKPAFILSFIILFNELIIDLLPTTKLARGFFLCFPFQCLLISIVAFNYRKHWYKYINCVIVAIVVFNITKTVSLYKDSREIPLFVRNVIKPKNIGYLQSDPNTRFLIDKFTTFTRFRDKPNTNSLDMIAISGFGKDSGMTMLFHGCFPDLNITEVNIADVKTQLGFKHSKKFSYIAYNTLYCLEEENCMGLLWENKIPRNKYVTLLWK